MAAMSLIVRKNMRKKVVNKLFYSSIYLPIYAEKDESGFYVVECPLLDGCYTQGKTLDEALKNIKEVVKLCLEETKKKLEKFLENLNQ